MSIRGTLAAWIAAAACCGTAGAAVCDADLPWQEAAAVAVTYHGVTVEMKRYSDGLYVRLEDGERVKEMYQLGQTVYITRGAERSGKPGFVRQFMGLEHNAWLPVAILAQGVPKPCTGRADQSFDFALPEKNPFHYPPAHAKGELHRSADGVIRFRYDLTPDRKDGGVPPVHFEGRWQAGVPAALPDGLDVQGWNVTVPGSRPLEEIEPFDNPVREIGTLGELKNRLREWRAQHHPTGN